jgi:hypothetical protein
MDPLKISTCGTNLERRHSNRVGLSPETNGYVSTLGGQFGFGRSIACLSSPLNYEKRIRATRYGRCTLAKPTQGLKLLAS